jgi:hypothetical protein
VGSIAGIAAEREMEGEARRRGKDKCGGVSTRAARFGRDDGWFGGWGERAKAKAKAKDSCISRKMRAVVWRAG